MFFGWWIIIASFFLNLQYSSFIWSPLKTSTNIKLLKKHHTQKKHFPDMHHTMAQLRTNESPSSNQSYLDKVDTNAHFTMLSPLQKKNTTLSHLDLWTDPQPTRVQDLLAVNVTSQSQADRVNINAYRYSVVTLVLFICK